MTRQAARTVKIAVVTDSTADLPPHVAADLGIHVVPVNLTIGQETYQDGIDITREEFYTRLPTLPDLPQTAAPAPGVFETLYRRLLEEAEAIVSIHVAAALSSVYSAACVGAGSIEATERVTIIDSEQLSMGLGWAVVAAAEASRRGETLQNVRMRVTETLRKVRVFAIFNTMEYLLKSGRISWLRASTGSILSIKPMVELRRGEVISHGRIRTWPKAVQRLSEQVRRQGRLDRLAVMHSNCPHCVAELIDQIGDALPAEPPLTVDVTPVIGTHVGPHALGVAALLAD